MNKEKYREKIDKLCNNYGELIDYCYNLEIGYISYMRTSIKLKQEVKHQKKVIDRLSRKIQKKNKLIRHLEDKNINLYIQAQNMKNYK